MPETRIKLQRAKHNHARDGAFEQLDYRESAPFFLNPRGVLVHRVRSLYKLTYTNPESVHYGDSWYIVDYLCNNGARPREVDDGLLFDPGDKLLCRFCEQQAANQGLPSASQLAGRHVCIGVCVPVNVCPEHGTHNDAAGGER